MYHILVALQEAEAPAAIFASAAATVKTEDIPASSVNMTQMHKAPDRAASMSTAPTDSAETAGMKHASQQGASSADHGGSARPAEESGSSQKQEGSACSGRFTPAQQAVVTALMVVIKRAAKDGREATAAAKLTLVSNDVATWPLLKMLPEDGPLPTAKQLEQRASDGLLESLSKLASLFAAAKCQPLEVFTRSVECAAHSAAANSVASVLRMHERQQRKEMQHVPPSWRQERLLCFQRVGVLQSMAEVIVGFLHLSKLHRIDRDAGVLFRPYLDHILPGRPQSFLLCMNGGS